MKLFLSAIVIVAALVTAAQILPSPLVSAQAGVISVPLPAQIEIPENLLPPANVMRAIASYPNMIIPAVNEEALAIEAELRDLGSDTDISERLQGAILVSAKAQAVASIRAALEAAQLAQDSPVWNDLAYLESLE